MNDNYKKELINYLEGLVSERRRNKLLDVLDQRTNHFTVVLEDVYQSHNFSAVLRSADIFGIQSVHFIENRNKLKISEDVAMGASKWLTLKHYQSTEDNSKKCLQQLKKNGYKIVATSLHQNSVSLQDLDIQKPIALVFGTELTGISKEVEDEADEFIKLPMYGFTESFNISVCAALCMHQLTTRMRKELTNYTLNDVDKTDTYLTWLQASIRKSDLIVKDFLKGIS